MRKNTIFTGSATALITPFTQNGVDYDAFGRLIDFQIENGTDALVICGTTGEPATMTYQERSEALDFALKRINKRVPVIVGTGSNATAIAVDNSVKAYNAGADALLVVTPYYNKCTQTGLMKHFEAICSATPLPVICYNVPGRTGVNIQPATLEKMAQFDTMCAVKEASGNIDQITEICARVGDMLDVYSGDDGIILPLLALGGKGVISVASNIVPKEVHQLCADFFAGNLQSAREMQLKLYPLVKALFCEVNPIPVKAAMNLMGLNVGPMRMPLCAMSPANEAVLRETMKEVGLL